LSGQHFERFRSRELRIRDRLFGGTGVLPQLSLISTAAENLGSARALQACRRAAPAAARRSVAIHPYSSVTGKFAAGGCNEQQTSAASAAESVPLLVVEVSSSPPGFRRVLCARCQIS